ncbi:putative pyridoxal-5-phosphate-dependent enzyme [Rhodococcus sp. MTM3W5.2]|nr:putative pyridoxal-5-phosphate-dependent enzyme [Rhodococcus sp. MTM3W5.2]
MAAIFPDGPQRYFDTVYNDEFCAANGLLGDPPPAGPVTIQRPDDQVVDRWTRCATVIDPSGSRA